MGGATHLKLCDSRRIAPRWVGFFFVVNARETRMSTRAIIIKSRIILNDPLMVIRLSHVCVCVCVCVLKKKNHTYTFYLYRTQLCATTIKGFVTFFFSSTLFLFYLFFCYFRKRKKCDFNRWGGLINIVKIFESLYACIREGWGLIIFRNDKSMLVNIFGEGPSSDKLIVQRSGT